ncbi:MAG: metal-sulfur cluster assembly factor [Gemmatimonadales bacterium]
MLSAVASPPEAVVWDALRTVMDPEYALSLVDLGLIYEAQCHEGTAHVRMTFTSIGCPAIDMMVDDVREALHAVNDVQRVVVDVVWDPPWTKDRISARGRQVLAAYGVT